METKKEELTFKQDDGSDACVYLTTSFNKGKKTNDQLLRKSIKMLGLGRSVVSDAQNNVICGDKVVRTAHELGIKKIKFIDTTGDELIVVRRIDIDARSRKSLDMSLVDNLSQRKGLEWNTDAVLSAMDNVISFDPRTWGGHECLIKELSIEDLLNDNVATRAPKTLKREVIDENSYLSLFD